jgi:integrase
MEGCVHKRVRKMKDGRITTRWYLIVDTGRDGTGRRRQKWHGGFRTRREAEGARAKIVNDINLGVYVAPNDLTLTDWVERTWLPSMRLQVKPTTLDSYRRNLVLHVLPRLGRLRLREITPRRLNEVYAELLESGRKNGAGTRLNPKTVRNIHATIHKVLADAVDEQLVARNAASTAKPPRPDRLGAPELRFWTPEQLRTFLDFVAEHPLRPLWTLLAMTGMRRGEALGVRWQDIDFHERRVSIRRALVSVAYELHESTPKSRRARVVDLDSGTVDELCAHRTRQQTHQGEPLRDTDLVFARDDGRPLVPDVVTQTFVRLVERSGLPRIRLHDLRHTHATMGLRAGVPIKVIAERLGHADPGFTLAEYAHVLPTMQREAAAAIEALVRNAS